jgi:hypothetical protein
MIVERDLRALHHARGVAVRLAVPDQEDRHAPL